MLRNNRKQRQEQPVAEPEAQVWPYYALTMDTATVAKGTRLDGALASARAKLSDLEAQRAAVDADLEALASEVELGKQQRASFEAQRDQFASGDDAKKVEKVANASILIDAIDRVNAETEKKAQAKRESHADLDRRIAAAADAVAAAENGVQAFLAEHRGRVPRVLVDWLVRREIAEYIDHGFDERDDGDSVLLTTAFAELPDVMAEAVAADPATYAALMQDAMRPKPKPRPTLEEARSMLLEGQRIIAEYEQAELAKWQAIRAQPIGQGRDM